MHDSSVALGLFTFAISLLAPATLAQQADKDPVQVSGAALEAWLAKGFAFAGQNHVKGSPATLVTLYIVK